MSKINLTTTTQSKKEVEEFLKKASKSSSKLIDIDVGDFVVEIGEKKFPIFRHPFDLRFKNFFNNIGPEVYSCKLETGDPKKNEAISNIFPYLRRVVYKKDAPIKDLSEEELFNLHCAVSCSSKLLQYETILDKVEEKLKSNITDENVEDRLRYAEDNKLTELIRKCNNHKQKKPKKETPKKTKQKKETAAGVSTPSGDKTETKVEMKADDDPEIASEKPSKLLEIGHLNPKQQSVVESVKEVCENSSNLSKNSKKK